ncbi:MULTISPECIES: DUF2642 domain-containing protein [Brevibacillus]|uniref:DUF2642 domain-containing protein n=1 Tax=Brevibacillus TaxID=55080 RepID=UPI000E2F0FC9|nr:MULTISPECIES: DUF2642 domain-containing protein [Brevibacillus]MCG7318658.1 DUF2642 domain-containing protein [Brevibacillus laterosporus]RFB33096.1 DUF2642 domain-containing protein [Brevibacillus sp. VP]
MEPISPFINQFVEVALPEEKQIMGKVMDQGIDILVLYDGTRYIYVPWIHVKSIRQVTTDLVNALEIQDSPIFLNKEALSYRNILNNAKGLFIEIHVTGKHSLHGYVTTILNNYLVFYSPIFKTMFISLHHLKWLIPYSRSITPFSLSSHHLPIKPSQFPLSRSFEEQMKRLEGELTILDTGDDPHKIGIVSRLENNLLELTNANGDRTSWNVQHIKTIHLPS